MTTFDDLVDPEPVALWVRPSKTPDGVTCTPWTDGRTVGFTWQRPDGSRGYAYLRPGNADDPWPPTLVLHRGKGRPQVEPFFGPPRDDVVGPVEALESTACPSPFPPCQDGQHRPDDMPEPGDRCRRCGHALTWNGQDTSGRDLWSLACEHAEP